MEPAVFFLHLFIRSRLPRRFLTEKTIDLAADDPQELRRIWMDLHC